MTPGPARVVEARLVRNERLVSSADRQRAEAAALAHFARHGRTTPPTVRWVPAPEHGAEVLVIVARTL